MEGGSSDRKEEALSENKKRKMAENKMGGKSKKGNITCEAGRISEGWFGCGHQDGL